MCTHNDYLAHLSTLALASVLMVGCSAGPLKVDPLSYESVPIESADFMPSQEELRRGKPRVAILPLELMRDQSDLSNEAAKALEPGLRSELEKALLESGKVELLDRNLALRLQGALAEYEKRKGNTPKPFQQADYLVIGQVDLTTIGNEYKAATTNSKGRILPGICITEGIVSGVLKIYDLLENSVQDIEEISGREREITEDAQCREIDSARTRQIYQLATKDAVAGSRKFLRKFFAPKGFISEKRTNGSAWAFKVATLGSAMSEYKTVKIFERREVINQLTGDLDSETLSVGSARITDQSGPDFVWIHTKDKKTADRIKLGHIVRPESTSFDVFSLVPDLKL